MRAHITAAGNVEVPAYLVLLSKGYDVYRTIADGGREVWSAQRNGHSFNAEGPIELLGVVTVFEVRGEVWKASDMEIDAFMAKFYPNG